MGIPSLKLQHDETVLARFAIFQDFKDNPDVLKRFFQLMEFKSFASSNIIIKEGDMGSEMFFMLKGKVSVFKRTPSGDDFKVVDLEENMNVVFGEGGIIDVDSRSATIKAIGQVDCLVLDKENFEVFSKENPQIALPVFRRIAKAVMVRLRKTNQDYTLLYNALVSEIRGH